MHTSLSELPYTSEAVKPKEQMPIGRPWYTLSSRSGLRLQKKLAPVQTTSFNLFT